MTSHASYRKLVEANPCISRWIVHLFQQKDRARLMLVVGAGASDDAGVPSWKKLVGAISDNIKDMFPDETVYSGGGTTFTSQILRRKLENRRSSLEEHGVDIRRLSVT